MIKQNLYKKVSLFYLREWVQYVNYTKKMKVKKTA
jgi:hypothetical protein